MEINYSKLESLFDDINEIINYIEISQYKNRRYRLFLGNGDKLNFQIPNESIAHLIGINTTYLLGTGRFKSTNSFELLKELCENAYTINQMHMLHQLDYNKLFSPYIFDKVKYFKDNISLLVEKVELVCKYDSKRVYLTNELAEKYDYIIIKNLDDGKIGVLCLVKNGNTYYPRSSQIFDSIDGSLDTFYKYLSNQEITTLNGINLFNIDNDFNKTFNLRTELKIEKIKNLLKYKSKFNCSIDVSGEYVYAAGKLMENRENKYEDNDLIDLIVESITEGKLINKEITRDTNLIKIIGSFNDYLCRHEMSSNEDINSSYTSLKKDLEYFKGLCEELKSQNKELNSKKEELSTKVIELESENVAYKERESKVLEILMKSPRE